MLLGAPYARSILGRFFAKPIVCDYKSVATLTGSNPRPFNGGPLYLMNICSFVLVSVSVFVLIRVLPVSVVAG